MLFNAHKHLLDRDGQSVLENGAPVTLGLIAVIALDTPVPPGRDSVNEKLNRFRLQMRLHKAVAPVEITVEEASIIKRCIGEVPHFSPLIVGRMVDALEGDDDLD